MTPRVHLEWARRVAAEYSSASVTAQALAWGVAVGLPVDLLRRAARIVSDELEHAERSHEALVALGGADVPVDLGVDRLLVPPRDGPLADLLTIVVRDFCLGETFAVPYFAEMRRQARHPAVLPVLDRVLADEAAHRAFGWDALDALIALDGAVPTWVEQHLPELLDRFGGYREPADAPPLEPAEREAGLLDNAEYAVLFDRTLTEDILPRFARRGVRA